MSDDDATSRTAVPPPLNCAKIEAASSHAGFQEVDEHPFVKGETVSEGVKVKPETERTESNDSSVAAPVRSDDHEAEKVKQRKCVQFTTTTTTTTTTTPGTSDDNKLRKFFEGEEILDKKNPFKLDERYSAEQYVDPRVLPDKHFPTDGACPFLIDTTTDGGDNDADDSDTDLDDNVFITKEEILRQSKYVKTYIKNPDKQLNYDKSVIQQMNALKAKGRAVRDVVVVESAPLPAVVRPPIPAPRTIHRQSDRNNNNSRRQPGSPQMERAVNRKPIPRARRDYAEVKVRTGSADAEESLYDSNEVVQNALKFDSRFRKVEFGSQDDIDTIAERTEDDNEQSSPTVTVTQSVQSENRPVAKGSEPNGSPSKDQPDGRKTTFAEDVKKSFSNTVKSADFRKYLQSKGLSLVPAKPKAIEAPARERIKHETESPSKAHRLSGISVSSTPATARQQLKPSMLTRLFQNSLFSPKTPNDPAYSSVFARSSTPVLVSTQSRLARPQLPVRFGSFNSSLNKRSATVDVKPKVSFRQLVDGQGEVNGAPVRRPASVNDFERPKLRTSFTNRSVSSVDSLKRPVKNAGVQVNLATHTSSNDNGRIVRESQPIPNQYRSQQTVGDGTGLHKDPIVGQNHQMQLAYNSLRHRPDARFYGGSTHTVAPLYSEPLREPPMMVPDETDSGFRSTLDNGYHIYEQTPDNLRRGEMVYGKIGYLSNSQLNRWQPHDRRSYSSMQEGVTGLNGGTYGRLRPLYVSSPLSTQSTPVRRASDVLDREQILHRIYDFCRRSVRNSSKTSVHSNQTEPTYQSNGVYGSKIVPSGSFPVERQRVQRVQSLNTPRPIGAPNYTRAVPVPVPVPNPASRGRITTVPPNQHERNIENIYAFVNKKMVQMNVGADDRTSARSLQTSTLRRVTFSSNGDGQQQKHAEADYVNIRGAPDAIDDRRRSARSREDPRRHTLGGDMLQYQAQTQPPNIQRSLDFETPQMRVYTPTNQGPLFDDDPGIMSEAETASTGFRRGGKQRSSLPVVRTPSKTLERPLGLVFLQYRSETKRALLPNEITSIDTVRALFVRSFPRQLTMQYLEGPNVKIYIHDSSKDMFYELEDVRSHLREIRDRSVLRLFESNEVSAPQVLPGGQNIPQPLQPAAIPNQWDQEQFLDKDFQNFD
uniref:Actin interacting protein 3-like C-terminal domain-containing protein n=1 Tax=Anopheles culicifacies TaxID=139723 RepID=A0A182LV32_9DIPT